MATSRDDFVIAIRSAFLKKGNQQRFSLIGLIFFSVGLLILSKINLPFTNYLKKGRWIGRISICTGKKNSRPFR